MKAHKVPLCSCSWLFFSLQTFPFTSPNSKENVAFLVLLVQKDKEVFLDYLGSEVSLAPLGRMEQLGLLDLRGLGDLKYVPAPSFSLHFLIQLLEGWWFCL